MGCEAKGSPIRIRFPRATTACCLALAWIWAWAGPANAAQDEAGVCNPVPEAAPTYAARIAATACRENALWFGPFIDADGRLASITVSESERLRLRDGVTPAWLRVAEYWRTSGLLAQVRSFPGAADCVYAGGADAYLRDASCRAFLSDTPWSAVFVSYVMEQAGVPGFRMSASHIDFIRDAFRRSQDSPYRIEDPDAVAPAAGDLLCFARSRTPIGTEGFREFLERSGGEGLNMHCDIVVAAQDSRLYLVGGNVLQGVTMRVLPLNVRGQLWGLPRRSESPSGCRPGNEGACSFNRQDWVALLKLRSLAPPAMAQAPTAGAPPPAACCNECPLPMPEHMERCAVMQRPADEPPAGG